MIANDEDITELQQEWEDTKKEWSNPDEPALQYKEFTYYVCCDTLGQDREINEADRNWIASFLNFFGTSWSENQEKQLKSDVLA